MKRFYSTLLIFTLLVSAASAGVMTLHDTGGNIDSLDLDAVKRFYFADSNAAVVRLQSPLHGETRVRLMPELRWQDIPGKRYELLVSEDAGFSDTVFHREAIDTNSCSIPEPLEIHTRYYWKVRITDAAQWTAAWYFTTYAPAAPEKIRSLAILRGENAGSFRLETAQQAGTDSFCVALGRDGMTFPDTVYADVEDRTVGDLPESGTYFARVAGANAAGTGDFSEVLAVSVDGGSGPALIVNGFDRTTSGNSRDFIRQHANALSTLDRSFVSASNEALAGGQVSLRDYENVIYILGEESTADETFSDTEQDSIKSYLRQGGKLFVSGAEIAWDLDNKGSASDKAFCRDYLRVRYLQDAPNNAAGTYYRVEALGDTIFSGLASFSFDDGSHGTYNVNYPDVLGISGESRGFLRYSGCSAGFAGVVYEGMFPGGIGAGKVMVLGFPFETVYPEAARSALMEKFFLFSEEGLRVLEGKGPEGFRLEQNYPNPFNAMTSLGYVLPEPATVDISIVDVRGSRVQTLVRNFQTAGRHEIIWNAEGSSAGVYFYMLNINGKVCATRKMILLK